MALVFGICYRCLFCCLLLCGLFVNGEGPYNQNEQHGSSIHLQQPEKQSQHHDIRSRQQQPEMPITSDFSTSSSASQPISSSSEETEPDVDNKRVEVNIIDPDNTTDNEKRQFATELGDKPPSIPLGDIDKMSDGIDQRKRLKVDENVANLDNKFNREGTDANSRSQEEYLQRYYGVSRKVEKEKRLAKEEKSSSSSSNQKTESASLLNKLRDGRSVTLRNENSLSGENGHIGGTDDEIIESKRRSKLYVFDKHGLDVDAINFTDDDDNANYDEQVSKYIGVRVKRRVARVMDEWGYEDGGLDYHKRGKERHSGGRGRGRRGKGKGSNPNGHDRSSSPETVLETANSDEPEHHIPRSSRRSHQRSIGNGNGGSDGGGGRSREGGGGGERGASRDRHHRNRRTEVDSSERDDSDRAEGYDDEETTHPASSSSSSSPSPPLPLPLPSRSPSDNRDPYGRYSAASTGNRIFKSPAQKTCHICTMKKMDREVRIRTIRSQIMKQIGLNKMPNITKNERILSRVPTLKHIIENMTMQRDEPSWSDTPDDSADDINEQMIIIAEKPNHLSSHFGSNLSGLCYFNVSGKLETSFIKEASLWIYLRSHSKIRRSTVEVRIWNGVDQLRHMKPLKIIKVDIERFGEWTHVKATSIVKQWAKNTTINYGLNITAIDSHGNSRIWTPNLSNHDEEYPVMDIKFSPRRHSRHRRTAGQTCTEEERTGRCCLYPLVVDFLEMKWYWVIHPHRFVANYCSGNCSLDNVDDSLPYAYMGLKSSTVIDNVRCCTSTREGGLQILYYTDSKQIILTYLENIVVKECGCR